MDSRWLKQLGKTDQIVEWLKPAEKPSWMIAQQFAALTDSIVVNPYRPNRLEPRVRKRRPKQYPLMTKPRWQLKQDMEDK